VLSRQANPQTGQRPQEAIMTCAESLPQVREPAPRSFAAPRTPPLLRRIGDALQATARAYWRRRVERATVFILHSLDDRTLKDIGIDRSEIESVVYSACEERGAGDRCSAERRTAMCISGQRRRKVPTGARAYSRTSNL
jgi:uncharacterized protein YjiS (DUF1127 family)